MTRSAFLLVQLALSLSLTVGCSEDASLSFSNPAADTDLDTNQAPGAEAPDEDQDGDTAPPEREDGFAALLPAQTDVYVFIANPDRGTVTRIDVHTKEVLTTRVGNDPQIVLTTPDYATAAVFNRGDDTVTVLDAGSLVGVQVPVRPHMNRMVMSPDGGWVLLWHDVRAERPDDPTPTGTVSFNEISLVDVTNQTHYPMVVGFSPSDVAFTPDDSLAVVVADAWLARIDLTAATPSPTMVRVSDDLINPPRAEEVLLAPSGDIALVRQFGASSIAVVNLNTEEVQYTPIGDNPTDLDLEPGGLSAVVVSRGSHELYRFDLGAPFDAPEVLDLPADASLGSLLFAPSGDTAVIYTTATLEDRYATWDLTTNQIDLRSLPKPVKGMAVTPTGGALMVIHTREDAPDAAQGPFTNSWALSLIDLNDFRPNTLRLPSEARGFVNSLSGDRGYLIYETESLLTVLDYNTLIATDVPLRSNPVWVGVIPDLDPTDGIEPPAWVSQEHPLGRIGFYNADDQSLETLTGFELNSAIED
jgi:DNA-binding beta-propeller fold protein YncE